MFAGRTRARVACRASRRTGGRRSGISANGQLDIVACNIAIFINSAGHAREAIDDGQLPKEHDTQNEAREKCENRAPKKSRRWHLAAKSTPETILSSNEEYRVVLTPILFIVH